MTFSEAKPFLKEGMKVDVIKNSCSTLGHKKLIGKAVFIKNSIEISGERSSCSLHFHIPEDLKSELEILTESDGVTPWHDPRETKFKVGDRVRWQGKIKIVTEIDGDNIWSSPTGNKRHLSDGGDAARISASRLEKVSEEIENTKYCDCANCNLVGYHFYLTNLVASTSSGYKPERKTIMRRLSELAATVRRAFSQEQKALWQVGYIDDCGKPSSKAKQEALDLVAEAYFKEHLADFWANANEELEIAGKEKE